jgi:hypothetical protein
MRRELEMFWDMPGLQGSRLELDAFRPLDMPSWVHSVLSCRRHGGHGRRQNDELIWVGVRGGERATINLSRRGHRRRV